MADTALLKIDVHNSIVERSARSSRPVAESGEDAQRAWPSTKDQGRLEGGQVRMPEGDSATLCRGPRGSSTRAEFLSNMRILAPQSAELSTWAGSSRMMSPTGIDATDQRWPPDAPVSHSMLMLKLGTFS